MNKTGISTLALQKRFGDKGALRIAKDIGADAVDFSLADMRRYSYRHPHSIYSRSKEEFVSYFTELRQHAADIGLEICMTHGKSIVLSNDRAQYSVQIENARLDCYATALLGASVCVFHPVTFSSDQAASIELLRDKNAELFRRILPYAKAYGIRIAIETVCGEQSLHIDELIATYDHICAIDHGNEHLTICMNTGKVNIASKLGKSQAPPDAIRMLGSRIGCVRLSDNHGMRDQRLIPFACKHSLADDGTVDWSDTLASLHKIGYHGDYCMDIELSRYGDDLMPEVARLAVSVLRSALQKQEKQIALSRVRDTFLAESGLADGREKDLAARAFDILMGNVYPDNGYPFSPYRLIVPARKASFGVWNWDTAFHAMGVCRWDTALAKENILGFLRFQREDGLLPDMICTTGQILDSYSKPPVFPQATERVYRTDHDKEFIAGVYPYLLKNETFWREKRYDDGLFFYAADESGTDLYDALTRAKFESGWDNSPRWDKGMDCHPIDLNCFMVDFYRSLAFLADELGREDEASEWRAREQALTAQIKARMWSEELGYYGDTDRHSGEISAVLTPASFMPLFIRIATADQARSMAQIAEKRLQKRMPTVSFDDPSYSNDYWRGPTWLNVAFFAAKGLKLYGQSVADDIREWVLNACDQEKRSIFENYDSVTGQGLCSELFSWSCVFILEFLLNWE